MLESPFNYSTNILSNNKDSKTDVNNPNDFIKNSLIW